MDAYREQLPLQVGDRVILHEWVQGPSDPAFRRGEVVAVEARGVTVRHNRPGFTEGPFAGVNHFNWSFREVRLVARLVRDVPLASEPGVHDSAARFIAGPLHPHCHCLEVTPDDLDAIRGQHADCIIIDDILDPEPTGPRT